MKKVITLIAAAAAVMLAISCQKENAEFEKATTGKLTATIVNSDVNGKTRVSYTETEEYELQPAWEEGDAIIGFDDDGNTYTLSVESVSEDGIATLSGTVPDGNLHLIYKYGAQVSDISNKTLTVDYTAQAGDETMPAVMLADGTVTHGSCNFEFHNAGAVINIPYADPLPVGSEVTNIKVRGENLSSATIALNDGSLTLNATEKENDAISLDFSDLTVIENGDEAIFSSLVLIAVPAGAVITNVSITITIQEETPTMEIPSTTSDKEGVDYVTIYAMYDGTNLTPKKWAKWNIGANNEKDYGWYFQWGDTQGHYRYKYEDRSDEREIWLSTNSASESSYVYEVPVDADVFPANGNTYYLCGNEGNFEFDKDVSGYSFTWATAPFNNGLPNIFNVEYFNSVIDNVCLYVGDVSLEGGTVGKIRTLKSPYDAAHVHWGDTWRMPTRNEFQALFAATYWKWDAEDKGYYVYTPNPTSDAGKFNSQGTGTYSKTSALLFFPAAGSGTFTELTTTGSTGRYWSSSLALNGNGNAWHFRFSESQVYTSDFSSNTRMYGNTIRPISD